MADRPSDRDMAVIRLVMRLQHVTSRHVQEIIFHDLTTNTPCKRSLTRLSNQNYLDRSERRFIGGSRGGSTQYIYRLGRRGHFLLRDEPYKARRQNVDHSLAVADCVVILRQLEREQALDILTVLTEPDCHEVVLSQNVEPDLYAEIVHPTRGLLKIRFEIDMATQGLKRIMEKANRYVRAVPMYDSPEEAEAAGAPPTVLWVAVDAERMKELRWMLSELPAEVQGMFVVTTRDELAGLLTA